MLESMVRLKFSKLSWQKNTPPLTSLGLVLFFVSFLRKTRDTGVGLASERLGNFYLACLKVPSHKTSWMETLGLLSLCCVF